MKEFWKRDPRKPEPVPAPLAQMLYPVCPYCGTDPAMVASAPFQIGPMTTLALFCSNPECRKIFSLQVLGTQAPPETRPEPRIVRPS